MKSRGTGDAEQHVDDQPVPVLALRAKQAARAIGISERLLWRLTAAGNVPHVRMGRVVVYPVRDLEGWLSQRARAAVRSRSRGTDKNSELP